MTAALPAHVWRHDAVPIEELLAAKERGVHRVSVVIPARDEEDSVGAVVAAVRAAWVDQVGLVDELVVIDSDSVDATAERAADAGATVCAASSVRDDLGPAQGKGEALWKALHVTTGDLLLFLDADLEFEIDGSIMRRGADPSISSLGNNRHR